MKAGCLRVAVALWIVALVAGGYAESYPNRPTAGEMDDIVALGTECVRGVNERCWATQYQTDPVLYRVEPFANTAGFYLDPSLMGAMASKIRSLVPYYVDPNTVSNGMPNIVMLTTNGLWATLQIGDKMNKFTCTPAIGTNAATYGDYPGKIYVTNLQERYKALWYLEKTSPTVTPWGILRWSGKGKGLVSVDSYDAASTAYAYQTNVSADFKQSCLITYYSNTTYLSKRYPVEDEIMSSWESYLSQRDLDVTLSSNTFVSGTNMIVAMSNSPTVGIYTNFYVQPQVPPGWAGPQGSYVNNGANTQWEREGGTARVVATGAWYIVVDDPYEHWSYSSSEGLYTVFVFDDPGFTGMYYFAYLAISDSFTNTTPAQPDCSGLYVYSGADTNGRKWSLGSSHYMFYAPSVASYVIYTNATLATNLPYWKGDSSPAGSYVGVNHIASGGATETNTYGSGPDPSGRFTGPITGPWTYGSWTASGDGVNRYISQGTGSPPSPSWSRAGDNPVGQYSTINGTGLYGVASAAFHDTYSSQWVDTTYTYTWVWTNDPPGTSTVYYKCELTKVVWTNDCWLSTNIEHQSDYWVSPTIISGGTSNYFNDQGLSPLAANQYNLAGSGGWSFDTNGPVSFGGAIGTPPKNLEVSEVPIDAGKSAISGFTATFKSVVDWRFFYCTNKWW